MPAVAERVLCATRLYRPARNTYQRLLNRSYHRERAAGARFYRQFVGAGDLAFDIGANRGLISEIIRDAGARVVAVEPNPDLAGPLERRYAGPGLTVERCAIGAEAGEATLHLGADHNHSTISDEWVAKVSDNPALPDRWSGSVTVPVRTLDDMIDEYGKPVFIKLDIEGFEQAALAGLSWPVRALSFEYNCPALENARACMERLGELGRYRFRVAPGEQLRFLDQDWQDQDTAFSELEDVRAEDPVTHGDVYARLV